MRTDDNLENHMVLNTPDAPWNQPDAPEESAAERMEREKLDAAAIARSEFCDALVEIAEFLEAHADVPLPFGYLMQTLYSREEFLKAAAGLARGGKVEKHADSFEKEFPDYTVTRHFGPIMFRFAIARKLVCRLVSPAVYDCPDSLLEAGKEFEEAGNGA
jgi:hypothetical protein